MRKIIFLFFLLLFIAYANECDLVKQNLKDTNLSIQLYTAASKCDQSLKNQLSTQQLYKIANEIRGANSICGGIHYLSNLQNFDLKLAQIALYKFNFDKNVDFEQLKTYFRYWAYQSIGNFILYEKFYTQSKQAEISLQAYFQNTLKLNPQQAKAYTDRALAEFLIWAVGETKIFKDISDFQKIAINGDVSNIRAYIYKNAPSMIDTSIALRAALLNNREISFIQEFLNFGVELDKGYESALFYALKNKDNVAFLIKNGANVNYSNAFGKTPLFYAIEFGNKDIISLLIDNGANINQKYINRNEKLALSGNINSNTPYYITFCALEHTSKNILMHAAAYADDVFILKLLVAKGAKIDEVDDLGFNALDFALAAKKTQNAEYLKSLGLKASENLFYEGSLE